MSKGGRGMTIDKTIEFFNGLECHTPQAKDARDVAIDTMRKYQKIEQIVNNAKDSDGAIRFNWLYEQIKEVVEDANN